MEKCTKVIRAEVGSEINLFFLGDVHEGSANHAQKEFKQAIQEILETPNSYVIGMGDYIDAISYHDKRFNPSEIDSDYKVKDLKDLPVKQMDKFIKNIQPIADKFIALLYGNHEESYIKYNNFDPVNHLGDSLPQAKRLGYVGMIKLGIIRAAKRDRPNYNIMIDLNHGVGGGGYREGYPVNKIHDVFRWTTGDIRVMGHLHTLVADWKDFRSWQGVKRVWYGMSGCFMYKEREGTRGYFEANPGAPSGIGMLKATIKVDRDNARIRLHKCLY